MEMPKIYHQYAEQGKGDNEYRSVSSVMTKTVTAVGRTCRTNKETKNMFCIGLLQQKNSVKIFKRISRKLISYKIMSCKNQQWWKYNHNIPEYCLSGVV